MDIRQLLYFTTIAEEGSISAAAKKLHLSQPPLSYQMKLLEEELHLPLIERSARGIALTEAGRVLYKRAQGILELSELTRKEMLAMASGFTGTLHIGTVSSAICSPSPSSSPRSRSKGQQETVCPVCPVYLKQNGTFSV